jgi:hypothetical protein
MNVNLCVYTHTHTTMKFIKTTYKLKTQNNRILSIILFLLQTTSQAKATTKMHTTRYGRYSVAAGPSSTSHCDVWPTGQRDMHLKDRYRAPRVNAGGPGMWHASWARGSRSRKGSVALARQGLVSTPSGVRSSFPLSSPIAAPTGDRDPFPPLRTGFYTHHQPHSLSLSSVASLPPSSLSQSHLPRAPNPSGTRPYPNSRRWGGRSGVGTDQRRQIRAPRRPVGGSSSATVLFGRIGARRSRDSR